MQSEILGGGADCQWKPSFATEVSGLVKWSFKYLLLHVAVVMQRNIWEEGEMHVAALGHC